MVANDSTVRETTHRIIPGMAEAGFLIHPFLETQDDINHLMQGDARLALRSVRFEPARTDERELWTGIHVRLYRLPEIPLRLAHPFSEYERLGLTNLAPQSVSSRIAVEIITSESPNRVLVHPPGEMAFVVTPESRCLTGSFGIREGAYTSGGATDGVTFTIQAETAAGERTPIWTRTLRPTTTPGDRGTQRFEACAPEGATRVILLSEAGAEGNTDWDWAYWAELRFAP
jgi:hypothetical protein